MAASSYYSQVQTKVEELCKTLITNITSLDIKKDKHNFNLAFNLTIQKLDQNTFQEVLPSDCESFFQSLVNKFIMHSQLIKANSLSSLKDQLSQLKKKEIYSKVLFILMKLSIQPLSTNLHPSILEQALPMEEDPKVEQTPMQDEIREISSSSEDWSEEASIEKSYSPKSKISQNFLEESHYLEESNLHKKGNPYLKYVGLNYFDKINHSKVDLNIANIFTECLNLKAELDEKSKRELEYKLYKINDLLSHIKFIDKPIQKSKEQLSLPYYISLKERDILFCVILMLKGNENPIFNLDKNKFEFKAKEQIKCMHISGEVMKNVCEFFCNAGTLLFRINRKLDLLIETTKKTEKLFIYFADILSIMWEVITKNISDLLSILLYQTDIFNHFISDIGLLSQFFLTIPLSLNTLKIWVMKLLPFLEYFITLLETWDTDLEAVVPYTNSVLFKKLIYLLNSTNLNRFSKITLLIYKISVVSYLYDVAEWIFMGKVNPSKNDFMIKHQVINSKDENPLLIWENTYTLENNDCIPPFLQTIGSYILKAGKSTIILNLENYKEFEDLKDYKKELLQKIENNFSEFLHINKNEKIDRITINSLSSSSSFSAFIEKLIFKKFEQYEEMYFKQKFGKRNELLIHGFLFDKNDKNDNNYINDQNNKNNNNMDKSGNISDLTLIRNFNLKKINELDNNVSFFNTNSYPELKELESETKNQAKKTWSNSLAKKLIRIVETERKAISNFEFHSESFSSFYASKIATHLPKIEESDLSFSLNLISIGLINQKCIISPIDEACHIIGNTFKKMLKSKLNIESIINFIQSFYLHGDGHSMRNFTDSLFSCKIQKDSNVIYNLIIDNFPRYANLIQMVAVELYNQKNTYLIELLSINFCPLFPISLLFSKDINDQYNKIFRFILFIKFSKYMVQNGCFNNKNILNLTTNNQNNHTNLKNLKNHTNHSYSKIHPKSMHTLYNSILRNRIRLHDMLSFIIQIENEVLYLSTDLTQIKNSFLNSENFDDLIISSKNFICSLVNKLHLDDLKLQIELKECLKACVKAGDFAGNLNKKFTNITDLISEPVEVLQIKAEYDNFLAKIEKLVAIDQEYENHGVFSFLHYPLLNLNLKKNNY